MKVPHVLFADAAFHIALLNRRDGLNPVASRWRRAIDGASARLVTTQAVLWEMLNFYCNAPMRSVAFAAYLMLHEDPRCDVVGFETSLLDAATSLYHARDDKSWSMVDCLSFVVMEDRGIDHALTLDHHFAQAGFRPVLREEPED